MREKCIQQISGKMFLIGLALSVWSGTQIAKAQVPKNGNLNQIAILIELQDTKFSNPQSIVDAISGPTASSVSLDNYFKVASAGKVTIQSHFPKVGNNLFIAKLHYTSSDLFEFGTEATGVLNLKSEAFNMVFKAAIEMVKDKFPTNVNFDLNNDNLLDIVSFHLAIKPPNDYGLPSFYGNFPLDGATINGKGILNVVVHTYQETDGIVKADAGQKMLSVMCHELMHAFGIGEYYYFEGLPLWHLALHQWDVMSSGVSMPLLLPSAHLRGRLGWIDIPEITTAGRYTLYPATSGRTNGVAYKILTNADPAGREYIVIEYRRYGGLNAIDGGVLDPWGEHHGLNGSGLVIYKVNTNFEGNNTGVYPRQESEVISKSELIAYRPGLTPTQFDGNNPGEMTGCVIAYKNLERSFFSADVGRTAFTPNTDPYPFLANGTRINDIFISNISSAGETISFDFSRTGVNVNSVSLDKTSISVRLGKGDQKLTPTILPENAAIGSVTWSSSNNSVATVSAEGVVSFVGVGSCTITVTTTEGNKTATCSVTVADPPAFPVIDVADEYPLGVITIPFRVYGVGAEKLTVFKVNGVEATEIKPHQGQPLGYEIEASSADGKIKITTHVIVK